MSPIHLTDKEVRALARMARGGVYVDRDGRGVLAGRAVIDRATLSALAAEDLIHFAAAADVPTPHPRGPRRTRRIHQSPHGDNQRRSPPADDTCRS
jgi:hypothetical protein